MQKLLLFIGVFIIIIGLFWPYISKIPFGRLPGDIIFEQENLKVFFPITTMLVVSLIISLVARLFR